jgi:hypothetical protein
MLLFARSIWGSSQYEAQERKEGRRNCGETQQDEFYFAVTLHQHSPPHADSPVPLRFCFWYQKEYTCGCWLAGEYVFVLIPLTRRLEKIMLAEIEQAEQEEEQEE